MSGQKKTSGFTLLETLVAVTILGMVVAVISSVLTTSMRNVTRAEEYQHVALLARSQMHELLALPAWRDGQMWEGNWANGCRWRAQVSRYSSPDIPSTHELMRMTLVARWRTKTYTVETARVQKKPL